MTQQTAFQELLQTLSRLLAEWQALAVMIREDHPLPGDSVLVDIFGDQVDNWLGLLTEAITAVSPSPDLHQAAEHLAACHTICNTLQFRYLDLISYERLQSFVAYGREQGGEWQAWVQAVKSALELGQETLFQVSTALLNCWQSVASELGQSNIKSKNGGLKHECR